MAAAPRLRRACDRGLSETGAGDLCVRLGAHVCVCARLCECAPVLVVRLCGCVYPRTMTKGQVDVFNTARLLSRL